MAVRRGGTRIPLCHPEVRALARLEGRQPSRFILRGSLRSHLGMTKTAQDDGNSMILSPESLTKKGVRSSIATFGGRVSLPPYFTNSFSLIGEVSMSSAHLESSGARRQLFVVLHAFCSS